MSVKEIEEAITQLKAAELKELAEWFAQHHMDKWDDQIAEDARSGKLDGLIARANSDFEAGRSRRL